MLDIGFPELLLVTLVILLVFGPERLPEVLRTLGGWIGQARRSFTSLKTEIEREIGADEIRRELHNSRILEEAKKVREEIEGAGAELRASQKDVDDLMRRRMAALQAEDQAVEDAQPDTTSSASDPKVSAPNDATGADAEAPEAGPTDADETDSETEPSAPHPPRESRS
ncbi:MAG: twin-arginine translocase subunit TatB [Gammaproteobacteria bacterium]|nr:MAG: twin-arginine translocase subunit TatB [Gammaproteobacteria bacterium]